MYYRTVLARTRTRRHSCSFNNGIHTALFMEACHLGGPPAPITANRPVFSNAVPRHAGMVGPGSVTSYGGEYRTSQAVQTAPKCQHHQRSCFTPRATHLAVTLILPSKHVTGHNRHTWSSVLAVASWWWAACLSWVASARWAWRAVTWSLRQDTSACRRSRCLVASSSACSASALFPSLASCNRAQPTLTGCYTLPPWKDLQLHPKSLSKSAGNIFII